MDKDVKDEERWEGYTLLFEQDRHDLTGWTGENKSDTIKQDTPPGV